MADKQKKFKKSDKRWSDGAKCRVRHDFTADEWRLKANEHIALLQQVKVREEEREAASAVAKAAIKDLEAKASDLQNQLSNGHEMKEVDAVVEYDKKEGLKRFYYHCPENKDLHHQFIKAEQMTEEDFQALPLGHGPADEGKPAGDQPELPPGTPMPPGGDAAGD